MSLFKCGGIFSFRKRWGRWQPRHLDIIDKSHCSLTFVGEDIPEMFPNVYWPDRGKDRIKHPKLEDQWCTDKITITQDIYDSLYEVLENQYTRWKERFGKLPTGWGRMVDYENAPPVPSWNHPNVDSLYL